MLSKEEFINEMSIKPVKYENISDLTDKYKKGERIIFTKFGDGEYVCMTLKYINDCNCDNDRYTYELGNKLINAYISLCERTTNENIYIGKWHTSHNNNTVNKFLLDILYDYYTSNNKPLKEIYYSDYHCLIPDNNMIKYDYIKDFVKTIKNSNKYKIIISNNKNKKLSIIFNGNYYIEIPNNSWFANGYYDNIKNNLVELLNKYNDATVLIAGGLASKVLINDITLIYPNVSFIDIGSAFDLLATKEVSRNWQFDENGNHINFYYMLLNYFKEVLPENYDEL